MWYGVLGNHDYNSVELEAEFKYNKYGWRIDQFFWSHKHVVGNETIAFVHIDTNYLEYGPDGEKSKPRMTGYFQKY